MPLPLIPIGISLAGALAGAFRNRGRTTKQTSTSTNAAMPTETPEAASLSNTIRQMIESRLRAPAGVPEGYETGGVRQINSVFDVLNQNKAAQLTARGLSDSPIGATVMDSTENARGGEIAKFTSGIPLVARQLQNEDLASAMQFYSALPRGISSTATGTGTQTVPGNMLGGGIGDLATMLAFFYGTGAFGGGGKG